MEKAILVQAAVQMATLNFPGPEAREYLAADYEEKLRAKIAENYEWLRKLEKGDPGTITIARTKGI